MYDVGCEGFVVVVGGEPVQCFSFTVHVYRYRYRYVGYRYLYCTCTRY